MVDALLQLAAHRKNRLAAALDSGQLKCSCSLTALRSTLGLKDGAEDVLEALSELEQMGMTGRGCAAWLRTVDRAVGRIPLPDLVWSGPEMPGAYARDTRRV
ncbi:MAG: hypothetical protein ACYCX3_14940, partial [Thermoleophilia bacterium]